MSTVTLTAVYRKNMETKYGVKPQVSIKTSEHGDKWLSTFKVAGTDSWQEGDEVNIDVQEKGDFINFSPRNDGGAPSRSNTGSSPLEPRVAALERAVFGPKPETTSEEVIQADDLPDMGEEELGDGF